MSKDKELQHFRALMARSAKTGENLGPELHEQRRRLLALGISAGEINEVIHDRHTRGEYKPCHAISDTTLNVPFEHKDRAKALGARWNATRKVWAAPAGIDLNKFTPWLP